MLKATKVFTIIGCIFSGLTFLLIILMSLSVMGANFGTAIIFSVSLQGARLVVIIAIILSSVYLAEKKECKYLIVNIIALVVTIIMPIILFAINP